MSQPAREGTRKSRRQTKEDPPPAKPKLPNIEWSANDGYLLWQLLFEIEKEDNRKVLFGKKSDQVCILLLLPDIYLLTALDALEELLPKEQNSHS